MAYEWIKDYLHNRQQYVTFKTANSSYQYITCGVPQGSILGPLLFILYINDIATVSSILLPILYAADTDLFLNGKDINELINMMNKELKNIVEWLNVNKLSLNVKKTQFMIFFSSRKYVPVVSNLVINNSPITRIYTAKCLGVFIDDSLTWKNHIQHIRLKISRGLGVLCKARKVLNSATLLTLYYTFIYPYISYCIEIWGSAAIIHIASVEKSHANHNICSVQAPYIYICFATL